MNSDISFGDAIAANHSMLHEIYHKMYFKLLSDTDTYSQRDVEYRLDNYFKFFFVRHPLERLLSAYEDKFNRSGIHRARYISRDGPEIIKMCRNKLVTGIPEHVTFTEFLCYVSQAPMHKLDIHWLPYWKICNFCESNWQFDFIGEYDTISEEANYLLDQWGLHHVRYPPGYRTKEEQLKRFLEAYSHVPQHLVTAIWQRFHVDFELFGYKIFPY